MRKHLAFALGLILPGLAASASAQIVPAQTFDASVPGTVWASAFCCDRTVGWEFTLLMDKQITALGVYDRGMPAPEPGLGAAHEIAIWDIGQVMLAMATVPAGVSGSFTDAVSVTFI